MLAFQTPVKAEHYPLSIHPHENWAWQNVFKSFDSKYALVANHTRLQEGLCFQKLWSIDPFQLGGGGSLKIQNTTLFATKLRATFCHNKHCRWLSAFKSSLYMKTGLSKNWHKAVATMSSSYGQAAAKLTVGFHKIVVKLWPSSLQKIIKMSSSC